MITAFISIVLIGVLHALLGRLPDADSTPAGVASAIDFVNNLTATIQPYFPIHDALLVFGVVVTIEVSIVLFHLIWMVYRAVTKRG